MHFNPKHLLLAIPMVFASCGDGETLSQAPTTEDEPTPVASAAEETTTSTMPEDETLAMVDKDEDSEELESGDTASKDNAKSSSTDTATPTSNSGQSAKTGANSTANNSNPNPAVQVSDIDCVTGQFEVTVTAGSQVTSVDLLRNGATEETVQPNPDNRYRVSIRTSAETVGAEVHYETNGNANQVSATNPSCGGVFGGNYEVCNGEAIITAYPSAWFSQAELTGDPFCSYFRSGPEDGHSDHDIKRISFAGQNLAAVMADLSSDPNVIVLSDTAVNPMGPYLAKPGKKVDVAHPSNPTTVARRLYLFEASGFTQGMQAEVDASPSSNSLATLDEMMTTLGIFEH